MKILRRLRRWFGPDPNRFLREAHGVIHVGANVGQEREIYARRNLDVLWVEPLPEVFGALCANIASYPRQRALEALVTDRDDQPYEFHVANNAGESSSIFDLKEHRDLWPKVAFTRSMTLRSVTLTTLLARENIDTTRYDALVMDTQGSELLVLKGAEPLLPRFAWIKTEVPDFEAYAGCVQLAELGAWLAARGFVESTRHRFATRTAGGHYYDVVFRHTTTAT